MNSGRARARPIRFYVLPAAALYVFIKAFPLLAPILFALLLILMISMAVNPVVARIRAMTGRRALAAGLLAAAFVVVLGLAAWAFFQPMKTAAAKVAVHLPGYWQRFQKPLIKLERQMGLSEAKVQAEVSREIKQEQWAAGEPPGPALRSEAAADGKRPDSNLIRSGLGVVAQGTAGRFTDLAFSATQIFVVLVTVFFGVTFTLMNPRPIFGAVFSVIPESHHAQAVTILQRIGAFMPNWALATLIAMAVVGSLVFLLTWPLFGVLDALVLGLVAAVLESIPYLGPTLSAVPALLLAVGQGGSAPLWVAVVYLGVQFTENNLISPLVMAGRMKLHPLAVMISMLLCVTIFGVLGLVVAAPLVAIVDVLHEELYRKRFLPSVTPSDLERMARSVLHEGRPANPK